MTIFSICSTGCFVESVGGVNLKNDSRCAFSSCVQRIEGSAC